jgi:cobalt/nickel transport system permease protein
VLQRLDPRWKLAGLFLAALGTSLLRSGPAVLLAFIVAVLLVALARLPWAWYLTRIGGLALVLALFLLPLPFLLTADKALGRQGADHDQPDAGAAGDGPAEGPTWNWGIVRVSPRGFLVALVVAGKALTMISLMLVLLATAPLEATLKAARSLGVPGVLVQVALLTYRYLFLLADELGRLRIALRVRGYRNRANRHSYRTLGHVAGTLLVRGYERAERVGQAMRCRGFDGRFRTLTAFRTTAADLLAFGLLLLIVGLIWWLDYFVIGH